MKGSARGFSFRVAVSDSAPPNRSIASILGQLSGREKVVQVRAVGRGVAESMVTLPTGGLQAARLIRVGRTLVFVSARAESTAKKDADRFLRSFRAFVKPTASRAATHGPSRTASSVLSPARKPYAESRDERLERDERVRKLCRENMAGIAKAQLTFRANHRHRHYALLSNLSRYLNPIPQCPTGGDYYFEFWWTHSQKPEFSEQVPELRLTVHCHIDKHGTYASGIDDDEKIPNYSRTFRDTCKQNMRELLRAQEIYKARSPHSVHTIKPDDLMTILKEMPKCPTQGNYSFIIGTGGRTGSFQDGIPNGTLVVWCDSYGHGGGTLDKRVEQWHIK